MPSFPPSLFPPPYRPSIPYPSPSIPPPSTPANYPPISIPIDPDDDDDANGNLIADDNGEDDDDMLPLSSHDLRVKTLAWKGGCPRLHRRRSHGARGPHMPALASLRRLISATRSRVRSWADALHGYVPPSMWGSLIVIFYLLGLVGIALVFTGQTSGDSGGIGVGNNNDIAGLAVFCVAVIGLGISIMNVPYPDDGEDVL